MVPYFIKLWRIALGTILFYVFCNALCGYSVYAAYTESFCVHLPPSDIEKALRALIEYERYSKRHPDKTDIKEAADKYTALGRIYFEYGDYESAAEKLSVADEYADAGNLSEKKRDIIYFLVLSEIAIEDKKRASRTIRKLKEILSCEKDSLSRYRLKYSEAVYQDTFGSRRKAESLMNEAYSMSETFREDSSLAVWPMLYLVNSRLAEADCHTALHILERYRHIIPSLCDIQAQTEYMNAYMSAYTQLGNLDSARFYQQKFFILSDSLSKRDRHFRTILSHIRKDIYSKEGTKSGSYRNAIAVTSIVLLSFAVLLSAVYYIAVTRKSILKKLRCNTKKKDIGSGGSREVTAATDPVKYDKANHDLFQRIREVVERQENFTDPDFSLPRLSDMTGSNIKYVSSAIKEMTGYNFRSFVNSYRIREACRRLHDDSGYGRMTIQSIAESVGFVSASAFISAFRQFTGMTPSAFLKQNNPTGHDDISNPYEDI